MARPGAAPAMLSLFLVLAGAGCATTRVSRAPYESPQALSCGPFVQVIKACAQKVKRAELVNTLIKIALCETGNKCTGKIDSPSGEYHGPFQFLSTTWEAQCRPVFSRLRLAQCASRNSVYDTCCASVCTAEIIAAGGIHNWPVCGK